MLGMLHFYGNMYMRHMCYSIMHLNVKIDCSYCLANVGRNSTGHFSPLCCSVDFPVLHKERLWNVSVLLPVS